MFQSCYSLFEHVDGWVSNTGVAKCFRSAIEDGCPMSAVIEVERLQNISGPVPELKTDNESLAVEA